MDKNVKNALIVIAAIFIGLALFRLGQWYFVKHQIESAITELQAGTEQSLQQLRERTAASQIEQQRQAAARQAERTRQAQARQAEMERQQRLKEQREFEANLLCAANEDTGKCTCYDRRTNLPASMTLEQCRAYVVQQRSRY